MSIKKPGLLLRRQVGERIIIRNYMHTITIEVVDRPASGIGLRICAPGEFAVDREEIAVRKDADSKAA